MNNVVVAQKRIGPTAPKDIEKVRVLSDICSKLPQLDINTSHIIHGGMYARTIKILTGTVLTGALIKVGTILIVQGDVAVFINDKSIEMHGYNVFAASANRKQAFVALSDVYLTTVFPTTAKTVKEAEDEFTDEAGLLLSRQQQDTNHVIITGE